MFSACITACGIFPNGKEETQQAQNIKPSTAKEAASSPKLEEEAEKSEGQKQDTEVITEEETAKKESKQNEPEQNKPEQNEAEDITASVSNSRVERYLSEMTMEEKVAQLFILTPEGLTGYSQVTAAGDATRRAIKNYPVGGLIYFRQNLISADQTKEMLSTTANYYAASGYVSPFLAVDEEGGRVSRIAGNEGFAIGRLPTMAEIAKTKDPQEARATGEKIAGYLSELGFTMDMAPVADVLSNPSNSVIGDRSFGSDPSLVSSMVLAECDGMKSEGIIPVIKHFPGHGATEADTHEGYAYTGKTLSELETCDLIPFQNAIDAGVDVIMAAHISVPGVTGTDMPTTLSNYMLTEILRKKMGFQGIIVTDAMAMGAITEAFGTSEAAVMALEAGADMLLMPDDFQKAYTGVLTAVHSGRITETRIDESVKRILELKFAE